MSGEAAETGRRGDPGWGLGNCWSRLQAENSLGRFSEKSQTSFCLCWGPGVSHKHLKVKSHLGLLLLFLRLWGKESPSDSKCEGGWIVWSTRTFFFSFPWWTNSANAISPFNFQVNFLSWSDIFVPTLGRKRIHLLCARHCVRCFYIDPL